MKATIKLAALGLVLTACGGATDDQLRARAAFDMSCPEDQLHIVAIDGRTQGVIGCGKRNTYVESCEQYGRTAGKTGCSWVLNGSQP